MSLEYVMDFGYVWVNLTFRQKVSLILKLILIFPISLIYGPYMMYQALIERLCTFTADSVLNKEGEKQ